MGAVDQDKNVVDIFVQRRRDKQAAKQFFPATDFEVGTAYTRLAEFEVHGRPRFFESRVSELFPYGTHPGRLRSNLHLPVGRAIHPCCPPHRPGEGVPSAVRGITQRIPAMCGCKHLVSAERFCRIDDEGRIFFRARARRNEPVSLAVRRTLHLSRLRVFLVTLAVMSVRSQ